MTKAAFNHPSLSSASPLSPEDNHQKTGRAATRYKQLSQGREAYLNRARECSKYTLPYLIPPNDDVSGSRLPTPFQSVGAGGVNNLASKLLLTMLPPNEPCFRLRVNNLMEETQHSEQDKGFRTKIDKALSRIEQAVLGDIESKGDRPVVYEGNLHLLVGGNILYHDDPETGLRLFPLSRHVVDRAPDGSPVEIVVEEIVHESALPEALVEHFQESRKQSIEQTKLSPGRGQEKEFTLYTHVQRERTKWTVYQECEGQLVPKSQGSYKLDACPWIPVRMYHIAGESYGRSYVENCLGDLKSLEALSKVIVEGGAVSGKVLFFVNPNSTTSPRAVSEAHNGDVLEGDSNDVTVLQVGKSQDFQVVYQTIGTLTKRLEASFLMLEGSRRDAERVTAAEMRAVAMELESSLGGVYTVTSQEFQLPFVRCRMAHLVQKKALPELPDKLVRPSVVTGFEALGRGNDKTKTVEFLTMARDLLGETAFQLLNPNNALMRLASSIGIPTEGLLKDDEQIAEEQQQAQQQQMMQQFGPEVVKQAGGMMNTAMQQQPQQGQPQGQASPMF